MPLFAPVLSESKKFLDPMQDARIIQRSEWLFELEIPIRDDMLPGMIFLKEYGGRYTVKLELLHKKFPDGYLFTDEYGGVFVGVGARFSLGFMKFFNHL